MISAGRGVFRRLFSGLVVSTAIACCLCAAGCRQPDPDVVLYVSADDAIARAVVARFEEETGLSVALVGDTETQKTTGLIERLEREAESPQADVFWSSEPFMISALAEKSILADSEHENATRSWHPFSGRLRVIVYDPGRVDADEIPQAWTDLGRSRFKDRLAMADPRFGTTGGHLGALRSWWNRYAMPGYYEAWIEQLAENNMRVLPGGNAAVVQAVLDGDVDFGLTDTDDASIAIARGASLAFVAPDATREKIAGSGPLIMPNAVALVRGAPNPEAARELIAWLLSPEVERLMAEHVSAHLPLDADLAALPAYRDRMPTNPMSIDFAIAASEYEMAVGFAVKRLIQRKQDSSDTSAP